MTKQVDIKTLNEKSAFELVAFLTRQYEQPLKSNDNQETNNDS